MSVKKRAEANKLVVKYFGLATARVRQGNFEEEMKKIRQQLAMSHQKILAEATKKILKKS